MEDKIIIKANTLLPNKSKKKFKKTSNKYTKTDIISIILDTDALTRKRVNRNLRERLTSLLSRSSELDEPINIDEVAFFLSLFKERLILDGISITEAMSKMYEFEEKFGGFSKHVQTLNDLKITRDDAVKIGYFPHYFKSNLTEKIRYENGLPKTQTTKDKEKKKKYNLTHKRDKVIEDVSNFSYLERNK